MQILHTLYNTMLKKSNYIFYYIILIIKLKIKKVNLSRHIYEPDVNWRYNKNKYYRQCPKICKSNRN